MGSKTPTKMIDIEEGRDFIPSTQMEFFDFPKFNLFPDFGAHGPPNFVHASHGETTIKRVKSNNVYSAKNQLVSFFFTSAYAPRISIISLYFSSPVRLDPLQDHVQIIRVFFWFNTNNKAFWNIYFSRSAASILLTRI